MFYVSERGLLARSQSETGPALAGVRPPNCQLFLGPTSINRLSRVHEPPAVQTDVTTPHQAVVPTPVRVPRKS